MAWRWLEVVRKRLLPSPPLPSVYIGQFLSGSISEDAFVSNIGDGWIGSDSKDWSWLDRLYEIERRFNPDFPGIGLDSFGREDARIELYALMTELRQSGR